MRLVPLAAAAAVLFVSNIPDAFAADDLLETLAQKGVLTMEEYEKLKAQRKNTPAVTTDDGLRVASGDNSWSVSVGTLQQFDFAAYHDDTIDSADGTEFRRSRLSVGGTFLNDFNYRIEYDFAGGGSTLTDAYVAWNVLKPVVITAGQFKQPFGMEAITADKNGTFMERGLPFAFVITRAPGLMVGSSGTNWSGAIGLFGEPASSAAAGDEGYAVAARATYAPFMAGAKVLHLGAGLVRRDPTDDNSDVTKPPLFPTVRFRAKPETNIMSQRLVDTGELVNAERYAVEGFELAGQLGAASLQSELYLVQVDRDTAKTLHFSGWYAQLAYTLTSEARPYRGDKGTFDGIKPKTNAGAGGWGAFEIAARISELDLTNQDVLGGEMRDATIGLNWYLNPIVRATFNYVKVLEVDGGKFDDDEPSVYELRLQLAL